MVLHLQHLAKAPGGLDGGLIGQPHHRLVMIIGQLVLEPAELGADLSPGAAEDPVAEHVLMDMHQHIVMVGFPADDHQGSWRIEAPHGGGGMVGWCVL